MESPQIAVSEVVDRPRAQMGHRRLKTLVRVVEVSSWLRRDALQEVFWICWRFEVTWESSKVIARRDESQGNWVLVVRVSGSPCPLRLDQPVAGLEFFEMCLKSLSQQVSRVEDRRTMLIP